MINSGMQLSREVEPEEVFQILIFQVLFPIFLVQIFLMIFLKALEEAEAEVEEDHQVLEAQI